ncbi:MAG: hypothetical protein Q8Q14_07055 [Gemmatimonadales bacterium]|nr:hypothetical protein [Gemmatimonadales bacterium]
MRTIWLLGALSLAVADAFAQRAPNAPRIALPEPWGPYAVGYDRFDLTDSARVETRGERPARRRIVMHLWYPARGPLTRPVPYMDSITAGAWARTHRLPPDFADHVVTRAQHGLPASDSVAPLPVLLFSHGRSWPVQTYQSMLQDLASRGWLVVGIGHAHSENVTVFADGSVARFDQPSWETEAERGHVLSGEVRTLVSDAEFVIETLARLNASAGHRFTGRIDTANIGYFGHSLGGAAAAQALHEIPEVKAGASIEGSVYDSAARPLRLEKPVLSIIGGYNRAELGLRDYRPGPGGVVLEAVVRGAWHASFADLLTVYGAFAPRDWHARHRRELAPDRVNQIVTDYLNAFFRRYLLDEPSLLLRPYSDAELESYTTSGYPEVELRVVLW